MKTESIGVWDGNNFEILKNFAFHIDKDLDLKLSGKKLLVRDDTLNYYLCVTIGDEVLIPGYRDYYTIQAIATWTCGNFCEIVSLIARVNTEATIRRKNNKLIITDKNVDFYSCVSHGGMVEIPVYKGCFTEEEMVECIEETVILPDVIQDEESVIRRMAEWGLL